MTGGPSAGKTSIVEILARSAQDSVTIVEEAASLLYRGGFPRSVDADQRKSRQYAIYAVQKALEEIATIEAKERTLVCDRGSLDGLAYWPGAEESFFEKIGSSMAQEIARYDWVIHLDTAGPADYQTSTVRIENSAEAEEINMHVKQAWRNHPQRLIIPPSSNFADKISLAVRCFELIHENRTPSDIRAILAI